MREFYRRAHDVQSDPALLEALLILGAGAPPSGLEALVDTISRWCQQNRLNIEEVALIQKQKGHYCLLVSPAKGSYDRELEDCLTGLELQIGTDSTYSALSFSTMAVPKVMLRELSLLQAQGKPFPEL